MTLARGLMLAAALGLAGCGAGRQLPDHPGTIGAIRTFYAQHAWEDGSRCVLPRMDVTQANILEESPDRLVVEVRYYWKDDRTSTDTMGNTCTGFATRTFTLSQGQVIKMSGPQR